jgi:hypothetical protein
MLPLRKTSLQRYPVEGVSERQGKQRKVVLALMVEWYPFDIIVRNGRNIHKSGKHRAKISKNIGRKGAVK